MEPAPGDPGVEPAPGTAETGSPSEVVEPAPDLDRPTATLYTEAHGFFNEGRFGAAVPLLEEVLLREPQHPTARNYLVECHRALGRDAEADSILAGDLPPRVPRAAEAPAGGGAASWALPEHPVPTAPPELTEAEKADRDEERRRSRNPRAFRKMSAGLGIVGPTVGLGGWVEARPHWLVAIHGGVGGLAVVRSSGSNDGLLSLHIQADFTPIPWRISPVIGAGLAGLFGSMAWNLDGLVESLVLRPNARLVPYLNVGGRLDLPQRFQVEVAVALAPTGNIRAPILPIPGVRLGLLF